jgi:hypothetical protein
MEAGLQTSEQSHRRRIRACSVIDAFHDDAYADVDVEASEKLRFVDEWRKVMTLEWWTWSTVAQAAETGGGWDVSSRAEPSDGRVRWKESIDGALSVVKQSKEREEKVSGGGEDGEGLN